MNDFEKRPLTEVEEKYTYNNSLQICGQTGCIGHLRADMDTDGNGFFSSWDDCRGYLKTDDFKNEFDDIINFFRKQGNFLSNRKTLREYCTPETQMKTNTDYYGVRVNTEKYAYLFRLSPNKGEYNVYCYCYIRDWLDEHIKYAERGIRFITPDYDELFRIADGDKIIIKYNDGTEKEKTCRYIDEYHLEIDDNLYHICEFAERMEEDGNTVEPKSK